MSDDNTDVTSNDEATEAAQAGPADLNAEKRDQVAKKLKALALGRVSAARELADLLVPVDVGTPEPTMAAELLALNVVEQGSPAKDAPAAAPAPAPAPRKTRAKRADA